MTGPTSIRIILRYSDKPEDDTSDTDYLMTNTSDAKRY